MGLKELILKKGWAGTTMSRQETIERINPILRSYYELFHGYDNAIRQVEDRDAAMRLESFQKVTRADIGKLSETVLSAGGVAYNGTDLEPADFRSDGAPQDLLRRLQEQEDDFGRLLDAELKENHQIRTRAVLSVLRRNSASRLEALRSLA